MDSSLVAGYNDNGWLNLLASNGICGIEWGVLVIFFVVCLFVCFLGVDLSLETKMMCVGDYEKDPLYTHKINLEIKAFITWTINFHFPMRKLLTIIISSIRRNS